MKKKLTWEVGKALLLWIKQVKIQLDMPREKHRLLPANLTWNLFSGRKIWTYNGQDGAKSLTAHDLRIVCWSWNQIEHKNRIHEKLF